MPSFVLVLIGAASRTGVVADVAREIAMSGSDVTWSPAMWLSPGEACDIGFVADDWATARVVRDTVAGIYVREPIDVCVVPAENRRKRLLVADMDSTIIQQECIDEMADMAGLKPRIAAITERAMRGELKFEEALAERLGLLEGLDEAALARVFDERVTLMPGARTLVATMRAHGAFTALVSGGFTYFTSRVAARVGFDMNRANDLELVNGRLTGRLIGPTLGREAKLAALEELAAARNLSPVATMAVGDGANDLAMIKAAGLGVAFRAKPIVAAEAHAGITHGDLTALLYLQGYRREDFSSE